MLILINTKAPIIFPSTPSELGKDLLFRFFFFKKMKENQSLNSVFILEPVIML